MKQFPPAQAVVYGLTWLSYATMYLTRKNFSVAKSDLHETVGLSVATLGFIDTSFLLLYAIGQFLSGWLGDRLGARRMIAVGMVGSGLSTFCIGFSPYAMLFAGLFAINGLFQSAGWANHIKAMEPFVDPQSRGRIMAFWGTNQQIGGMAATMLAAFLLVRFGRVWVFFVPAVFVMAMGVAIYFFLPDPAAKACGGKLPNEEVRESPNYLELINNPFLWCLSLSYFGLKLIRYSLLFWLPFYFYNTLGVAKDTAGYLSISFEVGGVFGCIVVGYVSDKYFGCSRVRLIIPLLLALAFVFYGYHQYAPDSVFINCLVLMAIGFLVFGPDTLMSGACAQDIGKEHTGSIAGFINGFGTFGALIQGFITAYVSARWGWSALFYVFFVVAVFSAFMLMPFVRKSAAQEIAS